MYEPLQARCLLAACVLAISAAGCEDRSTLPDNSATNQRDRGSAASPTPIDQGESEADRRITADIRKAIMAEPGLSMNAQNCKVITKNGKVTLRGPVATQAERDTIEAKAKTVSGVNSVVNELEVTPNP